jgi:hypothetical protein
VLVLLWPDSNNMNVIEEYMDNLKKFLDNKISDLEWLEYCKSLKESAEISAKENIHQKKKFIINE